MRDQKLGKRRLMKATADVSSGHSCDGTRLNGTGARYAQRLLRYASFAEEVSFTEDRNNGLLAVFGHNGQLYISASYVKQGVSPVALRINSLFIPVVAGNGVCVDPLEEIERGKATVDDCCHGSSPLRNKATLRIKHRRTSTLKAEQSSSMLTVSWHGVALRSALSDLF